jgi:hypothetical protein
VLRDAIAMSGMRCMALFGRVRPRDRITPGLCWLLRKSFLKRCQHEGGSKYRSARWRCAMNRDH